jgi:tripartite-type tricarboxylate transporter receptor subunit TctC
VSGTEIEGSWYGVFAPPQTPPATVARIQQEIARSVAEPAMRERLAAQALEPDGREPAAFKAFVERSIARYRELVKLAGIEPQ